MTTDPVADMLNRLMNASRAKKETALVPYSQFKERILEALKREELVGDVLRRGKKSKRRIEVWLRYRQEGAPIIQHCRRISRPGRRSYLKKTALTGPRHEKGLVVLSTPQGVLTHKEARAKRVGGEALFEIW